MNEKVVDPGKRRFLVVAATVTGTVATVGTAVPFIRSMLPSQRAKAGGAPVEVDIGKVEPGALMTVEWRGKVVWVLNRTKEMLDGLPKLDSKLRDPKSEASEQPSYCKNGTRSIKPELLVSVGLCTHLGCSPTFRKEVAPADLGPDWPGGFFCPCHGSRFDLAGRVFKDVPAPTNLTIPPHRYVTDTRILIGEDASMKEARSVDK